MSNLAALRDGYPNCPCGCTAQHQKLNRAGHVIGCACASCRNKRNRKKGQAAEARAHKNLGGTGRTVRDDLFHVYPMELSLETKTGAQVPAKFLSFARSETARVWWRQAEKKIPIGVQASPALYLEVTPGEWYVVVRGGA